MKENVMHHSRNYSQHICHKSATSDKSSKYLAVFIKSIESLKVVISLNAVCLDASENDLKRWIKGNFCRYRKNQTCVLQITVCVKGIKGYLPIPKYMELRPICANTPAVQCKHSLLEAATNVLFLRQQTHLRIVNTLEIDKREASLCNCLFI